MSLVVLEPGLATRLVDFGRPRTRSLGVPVGGAADRRALALGNALVGNAADATSLEICLQGPCLRSEADVACVLFGAPFEMQLAGQRLHAGHTFTLPASAELRMGGTKYGMRAYLCVAGGFQAAPILDSHSGLENIEAGATLACGSGRIVGRFCPELQPAYPDEWTLRVLAGLQASWFDDAEFFGQTFQVTPASNRMGLRLKARPLTMPQRELISEPVCPGTIQVTRDGQCIVLGVDGQTIGGYPKIAQVVQADLDTLGQIRPGQAIRFARVTMEDAIANARQATAELDRWTTRLRLSLDALAGERRFVTS